MSNPANLTTGARPQQKPLLGIALYVLAIFLIIVMNGFAKKAIEFHTPIEVLFYRGLVSMPLLLIYAAITGKLSSIAKTARIKSHLGRAIVGNTGVLLAFWSYSLMAMADVTAILFVAPLIITILSAVFLKEKVGRSRWLAVFIGFAGVLLIAAPSGNFAGYGIFVALGAAASMALVHIFLRDLGKTEDALTTVFYFLLFGLVLSGIYMLFKGTWPQSGALFPLIGVGVAGGIQIILKTQAFRLAEASLLSPFTYTSIVWATLAGRLFWDDLPNITVVIGAMIVIGSNLFVLWRERKVSAA